jgi:hypothetical protein
MMHTAYVMGIGAALGWMLFLVRSVLDARF